MFTSDINGDIISSDYKSEYYLPGPFNNSCKYNIQNKKCEMRENLTVIEDFAKRMCRVKGNGDEIGDYGIYTSNSSYITDDPITSYCSYINAGWDSGVKQNNIKGKNNCKDGDCGPYYTDYHLIKGVKNDKTGNKNELQIYLNNILNK